MAEMVQKARAKQPGLIVVDRAVPGVHQNYLTPEQHIPEEGLPYPWETCMTMAGSWSYTPNDQYKPTNELIEKLVDIVSKGGNFLLNIGPGPDGTLAPDAYDRMKGIGDWIKVNGEAIYGTRTHTSFNDGDNVRYTRSKDNKTLYVFLFNFPKEDVVLTKAMLSKNAKISMLGCGKNLKWKTTGQGVSISLPAEMEASEKHVWVLKISQ